MREQNYLSRKMERLKNLFFLDLERETKNTVFLVGDGRSGTTWVSNIINYDNEYRYMFEPFHPDFVRISNKLQYFKYLRPDDDEEYYLNLARIVFTGQMRSIRVDKYNSQRFFFSKKRLIKDIFAHLFLKWVKIHFPEIKIILLLRHPCAVAASKQKVGKWVRTTEGFLKQRDLFEDFLYPFEKIIRSSKEGIFEKFIIIWCIIHYVPFKQFRNDQLHLAFYENFCVHPKSEILRLFSFLGKNIEEQTIDKLIVTQLKESSITSRRNSPINLIKNRPVNFEKELIETWKEELTNEQIYRANEILNAFGLDKIYSTESIPNVAKAYSLLKGK